MDVLEQIDVAPTNYLSIFLADNGLVFIYSIGLAIVPTQAFVGVALNRREKLDVEVKQ